MGEAARKLGNNFVPDQKVSVSVRSQKPSVGEVAFSGEKVRIVDDSGVAKLAPEKVNLKGKVEIQVCGNDPAVAKVVGMVPLHLVDSKVDIQNNKFAKNPFDAALSGTKMSGNIPLKPAFKQGAPAKGNVQGRSAGQGIAQPPKPPAAPPGSPEELPEEPMKEKGAVDKAVEMMSEMEKKSASKDKSFLETMEAMGRSLSESSIWKKFNKAVEEVRIESKQPDRVRELEEENRALGRVVARLQKENEDLKGRA